MLSGALIVVIAAIATLNQEWAEEAMKKNEGGSARKRERGGRDAHI